MRGLLRVWLAMLGVAAGMWGCSTPSPVVEERAVLVEPRALPTYVQVAGAQNARVSNLDRVWAAATALVTYEDQDRRVRTEQAEGYLQIIQPMRVALSLGKQITSDVYFYLGSNDERYWWFDRSDAERKVAFVGSHALATPARAARFGAPVHPLDLLDLLGITELPEPTVPRGVLAGGGSSEGGGSAGGSDPTLPTGGRIGWSPDGAHVVVDVAGRFGSRRMWFEPERLMPRRVEILDDRGRVAVFSTIESDVVVTVRGDSRARPMMGSKVEVFIPGTPISVRMLLSRLENRKERQSAAPFDLDRLLTAYPVGRVEDIDLWEVEEGEGADDGRSGGGGGDGGARTPDRRLRSVPGTRPLP